MNDGIATIAPEIYRQGMSRLAAAVNIVTTDGPSGRAGLTATAVCSVTDTPPTLLVCVKESSSAGAAFMTNRAVCINTLGPAHDVMAQRFGGKTTMEERFAEGLWSKGVSGAPVLRDALVSFDAVVTSSRVVGTHRVLFCEVVDIGMTPDTVASVYFDRQFHHLPVQPA